MIPVLLAQIKTRDGIILDGIVVRPKKKSKTALIWIHGLASRFSSGQALIRELSQMCQNTGIAYFKFNTRGHDIANNDASKHKRIRGGGFEKFEDCIFDVRAVIRFAKSLGYSSFILAGHSTGANKVLYYLYKTRDRAVKGLILAGPLSDIASAQKMYGKKELAQRVRVAERLNPIALVPIHFGLYSPKRFISLYKPGKAEDVFPYHNPHAAWKELKSVRIPILIAIGSRDKHLDRSAKKLAIVFRQNARSTKSFSSAIIEGADHGFKNKEKELAKEIIRWTKRAVVPTYHIN